MNATQQKFGAPDSIIAESAHWAVQLRPAQATLGALVLIAKGDHYRAFSDLPAAAFSELKTLTQRLESTLKQAFDYDKINYLMLMMVDPDVHFHVLPRYAKPRDFAGYHFVDAGWPGPPALGDAPALAAAQHQQLLEHLQALWPTA
ncbi:MAG: HIT family protein [Methylococcales bacterium]|nr:HIT family protein [Methylococcales bacterium]